MGIVHSSNIRFGHFPLLQPKFLSCSKQPVSCSSQKICAIVHSYSFFNNQHTFSFRPIHHIRQQRSFSHIPNTVSPKISNSRFSETWPLMTVGIITLLEVGGLLYFTLPESTKDLTEKDLELAIEKQDIQKIQAYYRKHRVSAEDIYYLKHACQLGHIEVLKALIAFFKRDHHHAYQEYALDLSNLLNEACSWGHLSIIQFICEELNQKPTFDSFCSVISSGNYKAYQYIKGQLTYGTIDEALKFGYKPQDMLNKLLQYAIQGNHSLIVLDLLSLFSLLQQFQVDNSFFSNDLFLPNGTKITNLEQLKVYYNQLSIQNNNSS